MTNCDPRAIALDNLNMANRSVSLENANSYSLVAIAAALVRIGDQLERLSADSIEEAFAQPLRAVA